MNWPRPMTKDELAEASRRAKERVEQDKRDKEFEARSFHSDMRVKELISLLQTYDPNMFVGSFAPSDPNGPCTWERPVLTIRDGKLRIDNDGC